MPGLVVWIRPGMAPKLAVDPAEKLRRPSHIVPSRKSRKEIVRRVLRDEFTDVATSRKLDVHAATVAHEHLDGDTK